METRYTIAHQFPYGCGTEPAYQNQDTADTDILVKPWAYLCVSKTDPAI
jgi:hypothetical protein